MSSYVPTVAVKLFIDKEKQRVLFAESDKDFVDVLFSFLTLPLGTIVRLLDKQSGVGCLDEVYKSIQSLSTEHFQTDACKTMLLYPLNAAIISLLKRALISKEPLNGLYFDGTVDMTDAVSLDHELPASMFPKEESKDKAEFNVIKIKLIQTADCR